MSQSLKRDASIFWAAFLHERAQMIGTDEIQIDSSRGGGVTEMLPHKISKYIFERKIQFFTIMSDWEGGMELKIGMRP